MGKELSPYVRDWLPAKEYNLGMGPAGGSYALKVEEDAAGTKLKLLLNPIMASIVKGLHILKKKWVKVMANVLAILLQVSVVPAWVTVK